MLLLKWRYTDIDSLSAYSTPLGLVKVRQQETVIFDETEFVFDKFKGGIRYLKDAKNMEICLQFFFPDLKYPKVKIGVYASDNIYHEYASVDLVQFPTGEYVVNCLLQLPVPKDKYWYVLLRLPTGANPSEISRNSAIHGYMSFRPY